MVLRLQETKFFLYPITGLTNRELERLPRLRRTLQKKKIIIINNLVHKIERRNTNIFKQ